MLNRGSIEYARFWQPSNLELKKGGNVAIKEGGEGSFRSQETMKM